MMHTKSLYIKPHSYIDTIFNRINANQLLIRCGKSNLHAP